MWLFLFGSLIYAVVLIQSQRRGGRWIAFIVLVLMLIIVFRPEWDDVLRGIRSYQIASLQTDSPTSAPPYHLTVFDAPSDESALLALAESGLFDVTISAQMNPTRFSQKIVVEESDKCMTRRTSFVQFTQPVLSVVAASSLRLARSRPSIWSCGLIQLRFCNDRDGLIGKEPSNCPSKRNSARACSPIAKRIRLCGEHSLTV